MFFSFYQRGEKVIPITKITFPLNVILFLEHEKQQILAQQIDYGQSSFLQCLAP